MAHDWFLNRFLNPMYNQRTDSYGGTTQNRVRIIKEIIFSIHKTSPNLHISAKFSFFDDENGNIAIQECVTICQLLEQAGVDSIEVLGGHSPKEKGTKYESCYLELGQAVKGSVNIPVILTGNNHDINSMTQILNEDKIDFFALSRPLIREPELPNRWKDGNLSTAKCISCGKCYTTHGKRYIFNLQK